MKIYVIYRNPTDIPGNYVLRVQRMEGARIFFEPVARSADSLAAIRELLPPGLFRLERDPRDDPVIVESWI